MGAGSLVWHQCRKHGSFSDLTAATYFEFSRSAFNNVVHLDVVRRLKEIVMLKAKIVEAFF